MTEEEFRSRLEQLNEEIRELTDRCESWRVIALRYEAELTSRAATIMRLRLTLEEKNEETARLKFDLDVNREHYTEMGTND